MSHDSLLERGTCDWKVASSNPGWSGGRIFLSRVNFMCWLLFGVWSTLVLPQWHIKDPGYSAKSAGGRLHLNTTLTQQSQSRLTMLLSRYSVGTDQVMSSLATCQGTVSHSHLSSLSHCGLILAWLKIGISVRELISTFKKKEKKGVGGEWIVKHSPQILACKEKVTKVGTRERPKQNPTNK